MLDDFTYYLPHMKIDRFSVKKGESIPLHAHPNQNGFIYIISGKCLIKSYNIIEKNDSHYILQLISEHEYNTGDHIIVTLKCNAHAITAHEDTIFLDIFSPGVEGGVLSEYLEITQNDGDYIHSKIIKNP